MWSRCLCLVQVLVPVPCCLDIIYGWNLSQINLHHILPLIIIRTDHNQFKPYLNDGFVQAPTDVNNVFITWISFLLSCILSRSHWKLVSFLIKRKMHRAFHHRNSKSYYLSISSIIVSLVLEFSQISLYLYLGLNLIDYPKLVTCD